MVVIPKSSQQLSCFNGMWLNYISNDELDCKTRLEAPSLKKVRRCQSLVHTITLLKRTAWKETSISSFSLNSYIFEMAEEKKPLVPAGGSKGNPPSYDDAAIQHGALPTRPAHGRQPSSGKLLPRGPFPLDLPVLNQLKNKRVILASASPRRKQILSQVWILCSRLPSRISD